MANEQNLKSGNINHTLTPEEARKGGINSGKARQERKSMQELAKIILGLSLKKGEVHEVEDIQSLADLQGKNLTVDQAILLKQVEKALRGDLQSASFIRDTSGNGITNKVAIEKTPTILDNVE